jgi:integrase/recombinase XerD
VGKLTRLYDQSGNRKYLNPAERFLFYETVEGAEDLAHKSLCMVLIYTGCRISEALNLRLENIDQSEKALVFKTLKQRGEERTRALPVPDELIDLLLQQAASGLGSRVWKFTRWTGWRIVKKYMALAELDGAKGTPKGLRHAFAIDNLTEEVPLTAISKWLGHTNIDTTKIYLDFIGPDERALAGRAWPHRKSKLPYVAATPATSVTEVESFECGVSDDQRDAAMNARIKDREEQGWSVLQIEHLKECGEHDGIKQTFSTGMMVVFVKKTEAVRSW